jgi:hypothetical protein
LRLKYRTARVCYRNQKVSKTGGVFLDKAELPQAVMAGTALPAKYDAFALNIVVQQLCVGHGVYQLGLMGLDSVRLYGE